MEVDAKIQRTRRKILISTQVPAVKNVLTRPREHVRRLIRGLRGLGREAWGVGKVLVPGAVIGLGYSQIEAELETHLLTALAGGVVVGRLELGAARRRGAVAAREAGSFELGLDFRVVQDVDGNISFDG